MAGPALLGDIIRSFKHCRINVFREAVLVCRPQMNLCSWDNVPESETTKSNRSRRCREWRLPASDNDCWIRDIQDHMNLRIAGDGTVRLPETAMEEHKKALTSVSKS